jgi:AraC-like DNA-binding protein
MVLAAGVVRGGSSDKEARGREVPNGPRPVRDRRLREGLTAAPCPSGAIWCAIVRIRCRPCRRSGAYARVRVLSPPVSGEVEHTTATEILDKLLTTLSVRLHAFALCEIEAGYRLGFDPMDAVTVHYVLSGSGILQIGNGASVAFSPHSIMVVPARARQSLGEARPVRGDTPAEQHCEMIADGILKFTAGEGSPTTRVVCGMILATYGGMLGLFDNLREPIVQNAGDVEPLRRAFGEMIGEMAHPGIGTRALTEALMKQCLILLLRRHLLHESVDSPFFVSLQDRRLARAIAAILERPASPHTVDGLAQLAGMSRSSFTERFAQVFGQTPIDFVTKVRLRTAAHLLTTTDLPVKLVAKSIGYASRSYFSRAFRAAYGQDPASFRTFGTSPEDEPWADPARRAASN